MSDSRSAQDENNLMGTRMINAGLITMEQRDIILAKQLEYSNHGRYVRFGEIAIQEKFCTDQDIDNLPGYQGDKLVDIAGLLTSEQQLQLIAKQREYKSQGIDKLFGDLAVEEGFCTREEIEMLILLRNVKPLVHPPH